MIKKSVLLRVILIALAVAAASYILYQCAGGFAEGMKDAEKHKKA